jgi:hypothetical protein
MERGGCEGAKSSSGMGMEPITLPITLPIALPVWLGGAALGGRKLALSMAACEAEFCEAAAGLRERHVSNGGLGSHGHFAPLPQVIVGRVGTALGGDPTNGLNELNGGGGKKAIRR